MKALVIGANGFLARHLINKLIILGWEVDCIYHKDRNFIPSQCRSFRIDDLPKLKDLYDVVFLLSAFIPYGNFNKQDKRLLDVNLKIPLEVSNKFKGSKIIFASSVAVYGDHATVISENSSFNDPSLYGLSKIAAEFILKLHENYQIIRFSSIYGVGMTSETFIPKLIEQAKSSEIKLFGKGLRVQNYLYIDDAVNYLIALTLREESGVYLGVDIKSYTNKEVAEIIQRAFPKCQINYSGSDDSSSFVYNNSATNKILNFTPQISFEEGIKKILKNE